MPTSDTIIQLRELIGNERIAMLASRAPDGQIHSRPLTLAEINDDGAAVFFVDGTAEWVSGLSPGESVNLAFSDEKSHTWVSVAGTASTSDDKATMHRLWSKMAEAWFPDGLDTPELRLLVVQAAAAEYWDAPSSRVVRLGLMAGALLGNKQSQMGDSGTIDLQ